VTRSRTDPRALALGVLWGLYLVMWAGGVAVYTIYGRVRPGDEWAAPLFLALAGAIVIVSAGVRRGAVLLLAGVAGFLCEYVGLQGGWLFSEYAYTDLLAPKALGVPLVMISAWMVLVAYARELLRPFRAPLPVRVVAGAALLTTIDLVIDPLAAGPLQYWTWTAGGTFHGVPAHNFAGWFAASLLILTILYTADRRTQAIEGARNVGLTVVLFFTVLAAAFALVVPAAVGVLLCSGDVLLRTRRPGWLPEALPS
jgi:bisanhydrobacterioruberin hydratase